MNEYKGDEAMARLNYKYFKQRRIKNLARIQKCILLKESI